MEKLEITESTMREDDTRCRFLCCLRSKSADILANPKVFLVIFGTLTSLQGMVFTYFLGAMTTFEEHFQLKSEALGAILSFAEILPGFNALIVSYFCGSADRPKWIAVCMFVIGIGCYIITLPYYIFGVPPREDTEVNSSYPDEFTLSRLCGSNKMHTANNSYLNVTSTCKVASTHENNAYAVAVCFIGYTLFINGSDMLYIIGTPYLDDNVQQKNSPIYLGITFSMRSIGPLMGFVLSYAFLSVYVNPTENTNLSPQNPEWIGAWWLGYLVIGTLACSGGFIAGQFPIRLPSRHMTPAMKMITAASDDKKNIREENEERKSFSARFFASIKDIIPTLRRVLTNVPFVLRLLSEFFTAFALEGIIVYLSRYLEHQFRVTQSEASIWSGIVLIAPSIVGTAVVGFLIQRTRPSARQLTSTMVIAKIIYAVTLLCLISLDCDDALVLGIDKDSRSLPCDISCDCSPLPFTPVCGSDGKNYLSGCHAGCTVLNKSVETWIYQNCSCIPGGRATANFCGNRCHVFSLYVSMMLICNFLLAIQVVGEIVLVLRCVSVKDKSIAMGLISAGLSLLVFIPVPLVFSSIVDSACTLWSSTCGESGNCLLYDLSRFRYLMHSVPSGFLIVALLIDMLFWYKAKGIALFDEKECEKEEETEEINQHQRETDASETVC